MSNLLIKNGRVVDPSQELDGTLDVLILDGKVSAIKSGIEAGSHPGVRVVDAAGCIVTPGWVDMHTHLRDPGFSHKETIESGALAAAAGGFTSIACMANTKPVNDNPFVTSYIYQKASNCDVNIYAIGAITKGLEGKQLAEIGSMFEAGIVGISDDGATVQDSYIMRKALDYSKKFDLAVISHAECTCLKGLGVMNEGVNSTRFGLRGNPKAAEEVIVARDILLAELTGARLHIAHVSTAGSVRLLREAKAKGIKVTGEATPHHLILTDDAVGNYDTNTKVAPPLREQVDVDALIEGVKDGTIDALATDHAPHSVTEKEVEYDLAAFGMVGLEIALPFYYRLHHEKGIPLSRIVDAMTAAPAKILGLPKGDLKPGSDGDVSIFDPSAEYAIDKTTFKSKSRNTPFDGYKVRGKVRFTVTGGKVIYNASEEAR
ncbi:MAG: dihydroorotase [Bdellovibrionaceae bacterium]|nr:dihydroorotase [Pseudobdellovibrionaceae bacterium]